MKTLLFTLEYPPFNGGVANYYGQLADHWPEPADWLVLSNNDGRLLDKRYFIPWLAAYRALQKIRRQNPDLRVLVGQILPLGTVAWLSSLFKPLVYEVFLHGMDFPFALRSPRKKYLTGLILKKAHKIICANSYVASLVAEWRPELAAKTIIVNPGISVPDQHEPISSEQSWRDKLNIGSHLLLLSLGRLVRRKGVDTTLEALALLDEETRSRLRYVVAGTGPEAAALAQLAAEKKLQDIVYFVGAVADVGKWSLLHECDILVMPSRNIKGDFEGFGIVYLEANLCGKPVIAARSGGVIDAVAANVSGLLVEPYDPAALAVAIKKLAGNPEWQATLGQQGRERAIRDFDWSKQAAYLFKNL
jgi:phosphatidylinositol alpha-1,6-mannosyltransferase